MSDVTMELGDDHVATVELRRPPNNFFDVALVSGIADAYEELQEGPCRAIVLCAEGRHFCAGADLTSGTERTVGELYDQALRLFEAELPVVAAVAGAAIGGGLGLALSADFRVASPESRFAANFARLGFHHGFGLTVTLPETVGGQAAASLLYTGRRIGGEEAHSIGLCDRLANNPEEIRAGAYAMAAELAAAAQLSVLAIRATMRRGLAARVRAATDLERDEQNRLRRTADFAEGVAASGQRREPQFKGS
ncbi:MAG: enoyl-CoA hydratase/isomerase family protein [Acidimicrobiales bacterium]